MYLILENHLYFPYLILNFLKILFCENEFIIFLFILFFSLSLIVSYLLNLSKEFFLSDFSSNLLIIELFDDKSAL